MNPFHTALAELQAATDALDLSAVAAASALIADAGRIVAYGCGREGLQLRGFVMRLYHLGLRASMQGDMTTPALGPGDLLICSAGPGELATVTALMRVAQAAGADVLFLTAEPKTEAAVLATQVLHIPAQTMASDRAGASDKAGASDRAGANDSAAAADRPGQSALPMGSLYEGAMFLLFEVMVLDLRERLDQTPSEMRARHTNME